MKSITVEHSRCNVPGENSPPPPPPPFLSGAESPHGLIEATSNFGLAPIPGCAGDGAAESMRRQTANLTIIPPRKQGRNHSQNGVNRGTCVWNLSSHGTDVAKTALTLPRKRFRTSPLPLIGICPLLTFAKHRLFGDLISLLATSVLEPDDYRTVGPAVGLYYLHVLVLHKTDVGKRARHT
jgi:hypothetical protein